MKTIFNIINAIDTAVAKFVVGFIKVIVGAIVISVGAGAVAILISSLIHGEFHIPGQRQPTDIEKLHNEFERLMKTSPLKTAPKAPYGRS
jgi:hypothetical protein